MKENIISFFILSIFLLIGCSSDNNSSEVEETFNVSGKVVDSDGSGLANISITIGNQTVYSSASGEWSVSNLKGSVKITPMADGYTFTPASATASSTLTVTFVAEKTAIDLSAEAENIVAWFENVQYSNGLLPSTESSSTMSLYDNALAALVFTATGKYSKAESIFNFFNQRIGSELTTNGGFYQFRSTDGTTSGDRWLGDNAWLLIALNNYTAKVETTKYDKLKSMLEIWIRSLQDKDSGLWGGITASNSTISKNTEGMIDAYCAVQGYDDFHKKLLAYLKENRYNSTDGLLVSWPGNYYEYALDNHSWGYCTFEDFPKTVLEKTTMYANTQRATVNGALITGFAPDIDKDIVWLEGTGQMVVAYQKAADSYKSTTYLAEMRKLLISSTLYPNSVGLPYASNLGTTYGSSQLWKGADTNICISSSAWYLFGLLNFDPMAVGYSRGTPDVDKFWKD